MLRSDLSAAAQELKPQNVKTQRLSKWIIQYFFDEMKQEMEITDLAFPTAERGIAVGAIYEKASGREKYTAVITSDGGQHWTLAAFEGISAVDFLSERFDWLDGHR